MGAHHSRIRRIPRLRRTGAATFGVIIPVVELGGQWGTLGRIVSKREGRWKMSRRRLKVLKKRRMMSGVERQRHRIVLTMVVSSPSHSTVVDVVGYGPANARCLFFLPVGRRRRGECLRCWAFYRLPRVHRTMVRAMVILGVATSILLGWDATRLPHYVVVANLAYHTPANNDGSPRCDGRVGPEVLVRSFGRDRSRRFYCPARAETGGTQPCVLGSIDLTLLDFLRGLYHLLEDGKGRGTTSGACARGVSGTGRGRIHPVPPASARTVTWLPTGIGGGGIEGPTPIAAREAGVGKADLGGGGLGGGHRVIVVGRRRRREA